MPVDDKIWALIDALHSGTRDGRIVWKPTAQDDTFQAAFPNYGVEVSRRLRNDEFDDFVVRIFDEDGRVVDEYDDTFFPTERHAYSKMSELYAYARRAAMGVDAALDSILQSIKNTPRTSGR